MKKTVLFFFSLALVACGGDPYPSGKTLVEINGAKITEGYLEFLANINPNIARQLSTPFGKKQILDNLVEQEILYQAAKKEGIDHDPAVKTKMDLYQKVILAQAFVEASTLKMAKEEYTKNPKEFEKLKLSHLMINFGTPEEIRAARQQKKKNGQVMVPHTEKEALRLANQLLDSIQKEGKDFATIAKEQSEDLRTKDSSGDLGRVSKNEPRLERVGFQPILEKAFAMKVGEIAGPIKTTKGYHLITVTAPLEVIPFEEAKSQLLFRKKRDVRETVIAQLKEKAKVKYSEEYKAEEKPETAPSTEKKEETSEELSHPHSHPHEGAEKKEESKN